MLVVAGLLWLNMAWQARRQTPYQATFTTDQGVYGLRAGAPVLVGGLQRGKVVEVEPQLQDGAVTGYVVHFTVSDEVRLYQHAKLQAQADAVAGGARLLILDTGRPRTMNASSVTKGVSPGRLPPNSTIVAQEPGTFDGLMGPNNTTGISKVVADFTPLRESYTRIAEDAPARVAGLRDTWRALSAQVQPDVQMWRQDWHALASRAESAMTKLGLGNNPDPSAVAPGVRALRDELQQATSSVDTERIQMARATLARAVQSLDDVQAQAFAMRNALADAEHGLGFATADFAIAGAELAATEREALAAPWRLFAAPTAEQQAAADQVDSARTFAQAASEYERAVTSIRDTLKRDAELLTKAPGLADLLATRLQAANAQFERATERFSRMLLDGPAGATPAAAPANTPTATPAATPAKP